MEDGRWKGECECVNVYMCTRMGEWMGEHEWTCVCVCPCVSIYLSGWMDGYVHMCLCLDGWMGVCVCVCLLCAYRGMDRELHMCACMLSCIQVFVTPWTVASQASLSMGFSRQEYWSGLSFPPPGGLPDSGMKSVSCISYIGRWILYHWATWEAQIDNQIHMNEYVCTPNTH